MKLYGLPLLKSPSSLITSTLVTKRSFTCQIDAEPLERYKAGGYHPIHIGDILGDGRYKVIHKLGWGAYSTVWAARDRKSDRNVAVKVNVSSQHSGSRELQLLRNVTAGDLQTPASPYLLQWIDGFEIEGPNGSHACIVTELLGPSIADLLEAQHFKIRRLPAQQVKATARQLLLALSCLHQQGIGHGDVHTRNIAIKDPRWGYVSEAELVSHLGAPETASLVPHPSPSELGLPSYIVRPSTFQVPRSKPLDIRLIDFGEAFTKDDKPRTLHTPLALRAPEVIFEDDWDCRVDLWSAGCTIFELLTGQPPFDTVMITKDILVSQMVEEIGPLPERWAASWRAKECNGEDEKYSLEEWLAELYFDGGKEAELTREQLGMWARAIRSLMRFEPAERVAAADVLREPCFD